MRVLRSVVLRGLGVSGALAGVLACVAVSAWAAEPASCPNAGFRTGPSANLPDCRAYELVDPANRNDTTNLFGMYSFLDGQHVTFDSLQPLPGSRTGGIYVYLSSRGASGWTTSAVTPRQGPGPVETLFTKNDYSLEYAAFTSDFSTAFVNSTFALDPADQDEGMDVYRVGLHDGSTTLESLPETGPLTKSLIEPYPAEYGAGEYVAGASSDGSQVLFETLGRFPTAAGTTVDTHTSGIELYDRAGGHTYLVGVLPDGSVPACGASVAQDVTSPINQQTLYSYGAVSPDGTSVVFSTCPTEGHGTLFLRKNNTTTVELPGSYFGGRTADGSKILTSEDAEGSPVYEYDIASGQTTTLGTGFLLAASADGSRVYYGDGGFDGPGGLYLYENGASKLIPGTAGGGYAGRPLDRPPGIAPNTSATTADGSRFVFLDRANLTSYNSQGQTEVYMYEANTEAVTCISCNPTGAPPQGVEGAQILRNPFRQDPFVPNGTQLVSNDGSRVFFETDEALLPQDTNGLRDVYEWENGRLFLLSTGTGTIEASLVGVGDNGNDVFILTGNRLAPQVEDNVEHIYDARVGGGFSYTAPVYGCDSGQCQGQQSALPVFAAPGSSAFVGPGNQAPPATVTSAPKGAPKRIVKCAKGRKLKRGKCVKAKHKKRAKATSARSHKGGK